MALRYGDERRPRRAARARKTTRRRSAGFAVRMGLFVVDALREKAIVQRIPMRGFVGVNGRTGQNDIREKRNRRRVGLENEGKRFAALLPRDDDYFPLAALVAGEAPIAAVLFRVRWLVVAAEKRRRPRP